MPHSIADGKVTPVLFACLLPLLIGVRIAQAACKRPPYTAVAHRPTGSKSN
jgi:hypothetical protein